MNVVGFFPLKPITPLGRLWGPLATSSSLCLGTSRGPHTVAPSGVGVRSHSLSFLQRSRSCRDPEKALGARISGTPSLRLTSRCLFLPVTGPRPSVSGTVCVPDGERNGLSGWIFLSQSPGFEWQAGGLRFSGRFLTSHDKSHST